MATEFLLPTFRAFPNALPLDNVVRIELQGELPIFKAMPWVQQRVTELIQQNSVAALSSEETRELDGYEEMDDFLSLVNRLIRNAAITVPAQ